MSWLHTPMESPRQRSEFWGEQNLERILRSCGDETSEQIIRRILEEVSAFANGQTQRDDMTLVVMSVQEGCDI